MIAGVEQPCREILRLVTLAMLGIVVVKLANTPDGVGLVERRQGAWIALGVTGIMASSAATLYNAPLTRRASGRRALRGAAEARGARALARVRHAGPEPAEPPQPAA